MKYLFSVSSIIAFLAVFCFPFLCGATGASAETRAYENAVNFLRDGERTYNLNIANARARKPGKPAPKWIEGPDERVWDKSLRVLALTPSQKGDKYLARLAFFEQDGSVGESFGCAVWKRGETHQRSFFKHLRDARDNYETTSPCLAPEFETEKGEPALQCLTKKEYARIVEIDTTPFPKEGDADAAADCSDMLKPKKANPR